MINYPNPAQIQHSLRLLRLRDLSTILVKRFILSKVNSFTPDSNKYASQSAKF